MGLPAAEADLGRTFGGVQDAGQREHLAVVLAGSSDNVSADDGVVIAVGAPQGRGVGGRGDGNEDEEEEDREYKHLIYIAICSTTSALCAICLPDGGDHKPNCNKA